MNEVCNDNRFEVIAKYKQDLLDGTNIETSPDEMAVIDNILFRFWQMGWLLPTPRTNADRIRAMTDEELACFLDQVQVDAFLFGQGLKDKLGREEDSASAWLDWLKQEVKE